MVKVINLNCQERIEKQKELSDIIIKELSDGAFAENHGVNGFIYCGSKRPIAFLKILKEGIPEITLYEEKFFEQINIAAEKYEEKHEKEKEVILIQYYNPEKVGFACT